MIRSLIETHGMLVIALLVFCLFLNALIRAARAPKSGRRPDADSWWERERE